MVKRFVSILALSVVVLGAFLTVPSWGMYKVRDELPPSSSRCIAQSPEDMKQFINYFTFNLKLRFLNNVKAPASVTQQEMREQQEKYKQFSPLFEAMWESSFERERIIVTFDSSIKCYMCTVAPSFPLDLTYQDLQSVETLTAALCAMKGQRQWIKGTPYKLVLAQDEVTNEEVFRFLLNAAVFEVLTEFLAKYCPPDKTWNWGCTLL